MIIFNFKEIGNKLFTVRKRIGLTQAEVAELAGLSDRTYADIERGNVNMRIETVLHICTALNITPNEILTKEQNSTDNKEEILLRLDACTASEQKTALKLIDIYLQSLNK